MQYFSQPKLKLSSIVAIFCVMGLIFCQPTFAADKKDKSARRAAQMMQQLKQQMEQEKAAMQVQFDTQKKELEDKLKKSDDAANELENKLSAEKRKSAGLQASLKKEQAEKLALDAKLQQTQASLETTQKNLVDMTNLQKQALADLKINDGQRKEQLATIMQTSKSLQTCEVKNDKLHAFGLELIHIYDKPSAYQAVLRTENFTQIKRVELENILEQYRDKVDAERVSVNK